MASTRAWTRDELLVVFRLYCATPFGRLHNRNPEIVQLANLIGRTPGAIGLKACNFASMDPAEQARGIRGMRNVSRADRQLWAEFEENSQRIAAESEEAYERFTHEPAPPLETELVSPLGPTETERLVRVRRVQRFFRHAVLGRYEHRCALTGLAIPELLNASHIIPWAVDERRRAHPANGICLNALHDRAFDRGLLTFTDDFRAVFSERLRSIEVSSAQHALLLQFEGQPLQLPARVQPDRAALEYHRRNVFEQLA
jgi:putative restriction endonuclease